MEVILSSLRRMFFTTLIWFRSVYKISNSCWFCIHLWIKWELWKTFDAKMKGWSHFSKDMTIFKGLYKISYLQSKRELYFFCKNIACSKDKTICKGTVSQNEKILPWIFFLCVENALHEKWGHLPCSIAKKE